MQTWAVHSVDSVAIATSCLVTKKQFEEHAAPLPGHNHSAQLVCLELSPSSKFTFFCRLNNGVRGKVIADHCGVSNCTIMPEATLV